jgi:hypothetical protein
VKMRTPDSDVVDQSDDNENDSGVITVQPIFQKETSNLSDNSSISSDNSNGHEYIKQANVGFINEPLSLHQLRSNIGQLKEKKNAEVKTFTRATPMSARPVSSSRPPVESSPPNSRPSSTSNKPPVVHSPPIVIKAPESSSSTDYSQELNIRIPEVETVLPAHFTPPNIMIKKNSPIHGGGLNVRRPSTSPMISPKIITIPATSSSSHSSMNNSPIKSAPTTPIIYSVNTPERSPMKRSVSSLSPRIVHREVTMLHNLMRSPASSPARPRRNSMSGEERVRLEEATQTSIDHSKFDEMTQTPNGYARTDEMTQTSMVGDVRYSENVCSAENTPICSESPAVTVVYQQQPPEYKSWEELGIVDYYALKDLKSGVSHS